MITLVVWLILIGVIAVFAAGGWLGYRVGRRHEAEHQASERERMSRVDPPPRMPGQPTNTDAPPSRVTQPRMRGSRWTDEGDMQR